MSSNSTATGKHLSEDGVSHYQLMAIFFVIYMASELWWHFDGDARVIRWAIRRRSSNMNAVHQSNQSQPTPTASGLGLISTAALAVVVYRREREDADGDGAVQCMICLEQLEEGDKLRVLPRCKHIMFHAYCIDKWLDSNSTCPVCRADAVPPDFSLFSVFLALVKAQLGFYECRDPSRRAHASSEVVHDLESQ